MHSEFRNLVAYQRATELADDLWDCVACWTASARWSVGKQLTRAADSIGANIAEATGRWHQKDQLRALYVARGELFETEHWITTAERRGLLEPGTSDRLDEIARALTGLINKRKPS
jgi:four helix bundle protein